LSKQTTFSKANIVTCNGAKAGRPFARVTGYADRRGELLEWTRSKKFWIAWRRARRPRSSLSAPDGKMRVTSSSWGRREGDLRDQVLGVPNVDNRLHIARKPQKPDEWGPPNEPHDPYGPGQPVTGDADFVSADDFVVTRNAPTPLRKRECHNAPLSQSNMPCCARTASGHVMAAPPPSVMNSRRLTGSLRPRNHTLPYHSGRGGPVCHSNLECSTSALGQKQTWRSETVMSAIPPKADIRTGPPYAPRSSSTAPATGS
jgi:hypothetical protein